MKVKEGLGDPKTCARERKSTVYDRVAFQSTRLRCSFVASTAHFLTVALGGQGLTGVLSKAGSPPA